MILLYISIALAIISTVWMITELARRKEKLSYIPIIIVVVALICSATSYFIVG